MDQQPSTPYRRATFGTRRWMLAAASAAVVVIGSTTAWAASSGAASGQHEPELTPSATAAQFGVPAPTTVAAPSTGAATPTTQQAAPEEPAPAKRGAATTGAEGIGTGDAASQQAVPQTAPATASPRPAAGQKSGWSAPPTSTSPAPTTTSGGSSGSCKASYYDEGQITASGERFDPSAMTAAHKSLPLGSMVRVTNAATGKSVTVRINDRGPYAGGRCLDLSRAAFSTIGSTTAGVLTIRYELLS